MKLVAYSGVFMIISLFPLALIIYESLIQRKSLLKGHDPSLQYLILSLFMAVFFLSVGVSIAGGENYDFLNWHRDGMLYGFLLFITAGTSYHIVPFLLWWRAYAPMMGNRKLPTLKELLSPNFFKVILFMGFPSLTLGVITELFNTGLSSTFYTIFLIASLYYTLGITPLFFQSLKVQPCRY